MKNYMLVLLVLTFKK